MSEDRPAVGLQAKVLTVSDGVVHGTREDRSGVALVEQLAAAGFEVVAHQVVADGVDAVADGTAPPFAPESFDHVLLDAPCSGLGSLRRRPDARWRIDEADVVALATLQAHLLDAARVLVRPGGTITYSACTLTEAEGIGHDTGELASWTALPAPEGAWRRRGRGAMQLPQDAGTDGMVLLRWRRPHEQSPVGG